MTEEPQRLTLLSSGISSLRKRLLLVESAQKTIDVEFYIYRSDQAGRLFTQALVKKAAQGVKVRILIDRRIGNQNLSPMEAQLLVEQGIELRYYNESNIMRMKKSNHRSHRKSLIIDNTEAIIGGRNIADDYFDLSPDFNMLDQDIVIQGSIVSSISKSFDYFWQAKATKPAEVVELSQDYNFELKKAHALIESSIEDTKLLDRIAYIGDQLLAIEPSEICNETYYFADLPGTEKQSRVVYDQVLRLLSTAKKSLIIESPFFIQTEPVSLFESALSRGVKVQVLTNSLFSASQPLTIAPFLTLAKKIVARGADVFVYEGDAPRWLDHSNPAAKVGRWGSHGKSITIDDETTLVGSFNMDPRSANLNAEMAIVCRGNKELAAGLNLETERHKSIAVKINKHGDPIDGRSKFFNVDQNKKFLFYLMQPFADLFQSQL